MPAEADRPLTLAALQPRPLPPGFFAQSTHAVARSLVGCLLVHGPCAGLIVETEAYTGRTDPGSHAFPGPRTRNLPMFGPPGFAYVYRCHVWPLLNVVTEREGRPGAVLLRALQPVGGLAVMGRRRRTREPRDLARGPGRLAQALGVTLAHNRANMLTGPLRLAVPARRVRMRLRRTTRVGLKGPAARLPWRYYAAGSPFVSAPPAL